MAPPEILRALLSQSTASGARSTALQPLAWLAAILILGLALLPVRGVPAWVLVLMATLLGVAVATYIGSYIYFAVTNPDALRSEKFTLSKMAIEKNLIGDSTSGLLEIEEGSSKRQMPALPSSESKEV